MKRKIKYHCRIKEKDIVKIEFNENNIFVNPRHIFDTFYEAKTFLIDELTKQFHAINDVFKKQIKDLLFELTTASGILDNEIPELKICNPMIKNDFKEAMKTNEELYEFYEKCGVKFEQDYMVKPHSDALNHVAKKHFITTTYLDKAYYTKLPIEEVKLAIKDFEEIYKEKGNLENI